MHILKYYILILLLLPVLLSAIPIASVEDKEITYEQLSAEMEELENRTELTYSQIREQALENLIEENLLIIYAESNNISVDALELDSFFMKHLGDHPLFLTNGIFDRSKYLDFKTTETGSAILQEMEKEILVSKVKTVLISSFQLNEQALYKEFLLRNAKIDISYCILDVDLANVTENYTNKEAIKYFRKNRDKFKTSEMVKLQFLVIPFSDYEATADTYLKLKEQELFTADTTLSAVKIDSLRNVIKTSKMRSLAYKDAEKIRFSLELNQPVTHRLMETGYIKIDEQYGKIPPELIYQAFNMENLAYSTPFELDIGYIIFRVVDKKFPHRQDLQAVSTEVWKSYIETFRKEEFRSEFRDYFYANIDEFIIPVAVVNKIEIPEYGIFHPLKDKNAQDELIRSLTDNAKHTNKFNQIIQKYNLKNNIEIIYLEKFSNSTDLKNGIANRIKHSDNFGTIEVGNEIFFYKLNSYFPEYIPDFGDIQSQFTETETLAEIDSTEFQEFFHNYNKDFQTPDSLQLGGLFFPVITDSILIDSNKVYQYYTENINNYYRGKAVEFDCIYVDDSSTAHKIRDYAVTGIDFDLLKYFYNQADPFPVNILIQENELPRDIAALLFGTRDAAISFPVAYNDGWLVFKKIRSFTEGLRDLEDVYAEIEEKFQFEIADSLAWSYARMVFDSTRYYSQCYRFKQYGELFKTSYQNADAEFETLGYLKGNKQDLLRLWKNEKYSSIYPVKNGYAVVFQLNKRSARQLDFDQALPEIKNIFAAKEKLKRAKEFVNSLKRQVIAGADPDSLFFFLGGWNSAEDIGLESNLFGPEYSKLILYDIVEKEEGYYSPVLTLSENTLFFYRIDNLDMVDRQVFDTQKDDFRIELEQEKFRSWLKQFRSNYDIFINF